jgi:hypothetical protein
MTYTGFLEGTSNERYSSDGASFHASIDGTITLSFDSVTSKASVTIVPRVGLAAYHLLPPITGAELVWVRGATGFHQYAPGDPAIREYFLSGRFTGPQGEELIGGLRLEYTSPADGSKQVASASFLAKRPS